MFGIIFWGVFLAILALVVGIIGKVSPKIAVGLTIAIMGGLSTQVPAILH